jgi:hypothetical protein
MWDLPGGLQLSGYADVLATVCGSSRVRFIYGPRTVANHEQGREIIFNKEQTHWREVRLTCGFSQAKFENKFSGSMQPTLAFRLTEASN